MKRYNVIKELMERSLAQIKAGLNESDILRYEQERREDEATFAAADPDMVALEDEQIRARRDQYFVPPLGNLTLDRAPSDTRFMSAQLNSMSRVATQQVKTEQATRIMNMYDVECFNVGKVGINHGNRPASQTFDSLFETEVELRSVAAHNRHENPPSDHQQGGTAVLVTNTLLPCLKSTGTDFRGLGRWCWALFKGNNGIRTRNISVYNVGKPKSDLHGSVYQQHVRYIQNHGMLTNPRKLLRDDLLGQLRTWVRQGDRIVLTMDANEHVLNHGPLCRELTNPAQGLGLREITHDHWGPSEPNTWVRGRLPIDGVWVSLKLEVTGVKILPFHESVGDHRSMIFDITTRSLIGEFDPRIVRSGCRRLNTKNPASLSTYNRLLHDQMAIHRMHERQDALIRGIGFDSATAAQQAQMNALDVQFVEMRRHCERRCRKILKPELEFSPQVQLWSERMES